MRSVCADCWAAYERLANGASGVVADPWAGVWRERVERCGCAARNAAERERHSRGLSELVAAACPECGAAAGEWCHRHGVTMGGALLMCPARYRLRDAARGVEA